MVTDERQREYTEVCDAVMDWASQRPDIKGVAVVGSWARSEPRMDSDVDLVILTTEKSAYSAGDTWASAAVSQPAEIIRTQEWGAVTERRIRVASGLEIEFGFALPNWTETNPVDPGAARVVLDGCVPLVDRDELFENLLGAVSRDRPGLTALSPNTGKVGPFGCSGHTARQRYVPPGHDGWIQQSWHPASDGDGLPSTAQWPWQRLGRHLATTIVLTFALTTSWALPVSAHSTSLSGTSMSHSWTITHGGPISGVKGASLGSVSCSTVKDCFAVGSTYQDVLGLGAPSSLGVVPGQHPLIEHFDGHSWQQVASPPVSGVLDGVSCVSASFCLAVGLMAQVPETTTSTLIERFDGSTWSVMPSPNATPPAPAGTTPQTWVVSNHLQSVSCLSLTDCVAVGGTEADDPGRGSGVAGVSPPLSEHYDGSAWNIVAVSDTWEGSLVSVSCTRTSCVAVGLFEPISSNPSPGHYTGRYAAGTWERLDAPQAQGAGIEGIDCQSGRGCVGVGGMLEVPYTALLSSGGWRTLPTGQFAGRRSSLSGVSCAALGACMAVGTSVTNQIVGDAPNVDIPLIEVQSGGHWVASSIPLPDKRYYFLQSVSCARSRHCVAVGYTQQPSVGVSGDAEPLILSSR